LFDRLVAEAVEREADRERVAEALGVATEAMADVLAQQLLADAPRMLEEHRKIRNGFERRLHLRWGPALDLYECVRVCCLEAARLSISVIARIPRARISSARRSRCFTYAPG
jgi:hypothetical protein